MIVAGTAVFSGACAAGRTVTVTFDSGALTRRGAAEDAFETCVVDSDIAAGLSVWTELAAFTDERSRPRSIAITMTAITPRTTAPGAPESHLDCFERADFPERADFFDRNDVIRRTLFIKRVVFIKRMWILLIAFRNSCRANRVPWAALERHL